MFPNKKEAEINALQRFQLLFYGTIIFSSIVKP